MLKVGLVGCGGISGVHVPGWQALEDCEIVAICDVRQEMMDKYPGPRQYLSFDEMLQKEELDIVDICLPTYLHPDYAIKAMEKGINVLCEKPISLNRDDVERVYAAAEKNNVKFMVAQVLRFWPEYEKVKEFYDNKTYGKLLCGRMQRLGNTPKWSWDGWMQDEARSGYVPFDLHIHDLDWIVYTFGAPKNHTVYRNQRVEQDHLTVNYEFGDFYINAEACWNWAPTPFSAGFRFQFEEAVVEYNGDMTVYQNDGQIIKLGADGGEAGVINLPKTNAYGEEIEYFKNCVLNDVDPEKVKPHELATVLDIIDTFKK
jgi:predicted dehydrogenase